MSALSPIRLMATAPSYKPTLKAQRFVDANQAARLTYMSTDGDGCSYRLEDGTRFDLTTADCRSIGDYLPRWRHLSGPSN